jgi:hypothetical protein
LVRPDLEGDKEKIASIRKVLSDPFSFNPFTSCMWMEETDGAKEGRKREGRWREGRNVVKFI